MITTISHSLDFLSLLFFRVFFRAHCFISATSHWDFMQTVVRQAFGCSRVWGQCYWALCTGGGERCCKTGNKNRKLNHQKKQTAWLQRGNGGNSLSLPFALQSFSLLPLMFMFFCFCCMSGGAWWERVGGGDLLQ